MTPETLKAWRKTNRLRQVDAAALAGVSRETWINWERPGTAVPTLVAWMTAAWDAGIDLDGTGSPARPG